MSPIYKVELSRYKNRAIQDVVQKHTNTQKIQSCYKTPVHISAEAYEYTDHNSIMQ